MSFPENGLTKKKTEFFSENEKKKKKCKITVTQFEPSPAVSVPDVNETK